MNIRVMLETFSKKKDPAQLIDGSPDADFNCFYHVDVELPDQKNVARFEGFDGEKLEISLLDERFDRKHLFIDIEDLNPDYFSGFFSYKRNRLFFDSLSEINNRKIFLFKAKTTISKFFESRRLRKYKAQRIRVKRQLDVLNVVMDCCLENGMEKVGVYTIVDRLHGKNWLHHPDSEIMKREVNFYIDAFVKTGELEKNASAISPTGKALLKIQEITAEQIRYDEAKSMQKKMLITAILSFLAAAASALTSYLTYIKPHT